MSTRPLQPFLNRVLLGDCLQVMRAMPPASVDYVLTDPPYLVRYRSRDGRTLANDDQAQWLPPAFAAIARLLKPHRFCVSFYGWQAADQFLAAWRAAGLRPVGHFVWTKDYTSSSLGYTRARHECAYLLAKGEPILSQPAPPDVLPWGRYTHNLLHPTQKPVEALLPLIAAYSEVGDIILDPFAGSGTTAVAAHQLQRRYVAIELRPAYHALACQRLQAAAPL